MADECIPILEWPPRDDSDTVNNLECSGDDSNEADSDEDEDESSQSKKIRIEFDHPHASIALTRWLKTSLKKLKIKYQLEDLQNPQTLVNVLTDTEEGRSFLEKETQSLLKSEEKFKNDPNFYFVLTTYFDKLQDSRRSSESISKCLNLLSYKVDIMELELKKYLAKLSELTDFERNVLWLSQKIGLETEMRSKSVDLDSRQRAVEVVTYSSMSPERFSSLCKSRCPVLLTDVPPPTEQVWSETHLKARAGHIKVQLKRRVAGSTEWAGLEKAGLKTVSQYLEDSQEGEYLFDWSLPLHCPELSDEFLLPALLQDNILTSTSPHALYRNSWPSLFIAKAGTNSGLHIDAFGSHFWMYLVSGEKKWTFYPPEAAGKLGPKFHDSLDPVFTPGPSLALLPSYSVLLRPGHLLCVPAGSPHQVENITDSVAVSGNFVNHTNIQEALRYFKINALLDPRSEDLLRELSDRNF